MRSIGLPELLVICAVVPGVIVVQLIPLWRIFSKAGFAGVLSLLTCLPLVGFVVLYVVAFSEWPMHRELLELRAKGISSQ